MSDNEAVRQHREFLFPAVTTYYAEPLTLVRGEGLHVWDDEGRQYLDALGGVLTVSVGHANPQRRRGHRRTGEDPGPHFHAVR